jgi:hypothetical protein
LLQPPRDRAVKRRIESAAEVESALRNMVDAARIFRERLTSSSS